MAMSRIQEIIQGLQKEGLTQTEIAARSGVPQCRISRWSRGGAARAADDALRLAELGASLEGALPPVLRGNQEAAHG